jgi:hypothetical protein
MRSTLSSGFRKTHPGAVIAALLVTLAGIAIGYQLFLGMVTFIQNIGAHLPGCTKALTNPN